MTILQSEKLLFAKWKRKWPRFIEDGVVDEETYLASSPKLLFVLKEANDSDPGPGGWDLRKFLQDGARSQTWDTVTRWVEGIRRLPEDIPWQEVAEVDAERRRRTLRSIAALNLKKFPGGHTTDGGVLRAAALEDKLFLEKQFAIYDPDIVIFCGTCDLYCGIFELDAPSKCTQRGVLYYEFKPKHFMVSYAHPEARVAKNLVHYGLVDALREILGKHK